MLFFFCSGASKSTTWYFSYWQLKKERKRPYFLIWCEWRESNSHPKFGKLVY